MIKTLAVQQRSYVYASTSLSPETLAMGYEDDTPGCHCEKPLQAQIAFETKYSHGKNLLVVFGNIRIQQLTGSIHLIQ